LQALVFVEDTCGAVLIECNEILANPRKTGHFYAYPQLIHTLVHRNCERSVTANCVAKTVAYTIAAGERGRRYTQVNAALRSG
jgi:hypothetical protein